MRNAKEINAVLDKLEAKSFAYGVWILALAVRAPMETHALLLSRAADADAQLLATEMPDEVRARVVAELRLLNEQLLVLSDLQAKSGGGPDTTPAGS